MDLSDLNETELIKFILHITKKSITYYSSFSFQMNFEHFTITVFIFYLLEQVHDSSYIEPLIEAFCVVRVGVHRLSF